MVMKLLAKAAFCSILMAGAASASTFNFLGFSPDSPSKVFSIDGVTVTVTAGTFSSASNNTAIDFSTRDVDQGMTRGLGVVADDDSRQIDGSGGADVLVFSFDRTVTIDALSLDRVDNKDHFAFGTVSGGIFDRIVDLQQATATVDMAATFGSVWGTSFGIGAIEASDDFSIKSLSFTALPNAFAVAPVPLPASSLLLVAGLGGLTAMRRIKRRA
jgi:hypothetical protein